MFTVIIPTYNSSSRILSTISSVLDQTYKVFEVIIVDDGSTDDTADIVKQIKDPRLKYIYKPNGGPASARNLGIEQAQFNYICFLDSDDTFSKKKLQSSLNVITEYPQVDLIFTDAIYINEKNGTHSIFSQLTQIHTQKIFKHLLKNNFIVNSTVVLNKKRLLSIGARFDEDIKLRFVEDYDLWLKLALKGFTFFYINDTLTNYYIHGTNNSSNAARTYRSLIKIYKKYLISSPGIVITIARLYLRIYLKKRR